MNKPRNGTDCKDKKVFLIRKISNRFFKKEQRNSLYIEKKNPRHNKSP